MTNAAAPVRGYLRETGLLAGRTLGYIPRAPWQLADVTIQPIIFILLFGYVFGSAMRLPDGANYHTYLIPGLFVTSLTSTLGGLMTGMATDIRSGFTDRLRSLPITRTAIISGRLLAELVTNSLGLAVLVGAGLVIGWRPEGSPGGTAAAIGLMLAWAFSFSWIGAYLGTASRDAESASTLAMVAVFPLMFLSGVFVTPAELPAPVRQIAQWNPLTTAATGIRRLFGNPTPGLGHAWILGHPVAGTLAWCVLIVAVFAPLATRRILRMNRQ
jgi:ABC-2 type transport system permease protein